MKGKEASLLALRIVLATIFMYHGLPKMLNPSGMTSFFSSIGLPGFSVVVIGLIEVSAAILIIIGLWHTRANYALAAVMAGAIVLVHIPNLIVTFAQNGISAQLERDLLIFVAALALATGGPGHYAWAKKK